MPSNGLLGADADRDRRIAVLLDLHIGPLEGLHGERAVAVTREPLKPGQDEAGRADQCAVVGVHGSQGRDVAALFGLGPAAAQIADLGVVLVGIQGTTLTHHLNAMEADGSVTRRRDPENRRVHVVELTDDGEAAFQRMRKAAVEFDRKLRGDLSDEELDRFAAVLGRLRANATGG